MNVSQLEYFVVATQHESFTSAADALYVTPQAVSKSMASLERELGVQLFARTAAGIAPTALGMALAYPADEALKDLDELRTLAHRNSSIASGRIMILRARHLT